MSENDLSQFYKLRKEIDDLERRIKELGYGVGSMKIKDVVTQGDTSKESIQEKLAILNDMYNERRVTAIETYLRIESYIETVEDPEIRTLMRYRYLDLNTWEEISAKTFQERTTVAKKIRRYLKEK